MKCKFCENEYYIKLNFPKMTLCKGHFLKYFEKKVERTIKKYRLLSEGERILIGVSGGKDSAVVAYVLKKLGYEIGCVHINLGIEDYSTRSEVFAQHQCELLGLQLPVVKVKAQLGTSIGELRTRRATCSSCGITKRYILNKFAYDNGFDVVATGHNLDDESSFIFGNVMNWNTQYLARQGPFLPGQGKFVKRVKPLYELSEREIKAYAQAVGLEFIGCRCPKGKGATTTSYKALLAKIEEKNPGTRLNFVRGFLRKRELFKEELEEFELNECEVCGMFTSRKICAFCSLWRLKEPVDFKLNALI